MRATGSDHPNMDSSPFDEQPMLGQHQRDPFISPLPQSRSSRPAETPISGRLQPTYDLISGESRTPHRSSPVSFSPVIIRSPKRSPSVAQDSASTADVSNETLRSELGSARYELDVLRQERELEKVQHEQELRALEAQLEEQAKRVDSVETEKRFLLEKQTEQAEITKKTKATATAAKQNFERQIRMLKAEIASWKETVTDKQDEIDSEYRKHRSGMAEKDGIIRMLEQSLEELKVEMETKNSVLEETHKKLSEKVEEVQELETELLKMRTQTGDADTLRILKRELSDQVHHIKTLEGTNRRQASELQQVRGSLRSLELVEEEKRSLESKIKVLEDLRSELSSAQVRISVLEDERRSWEGYFESEGLEFDSPEALAKALVEERLDKAALLEKLGRTNPEVAQKDGAILQLQSSLSQAEKDIRELQERLAKDMKSRQRLERQRTLALREADFLREQLKSFSSEETIYMQGNFDEQKSFRIRNLEQLLEEYKAEIEELKSAAQPSDNDAPSGPRPKRPIDDDDDQRVGQLTRKNRQLQEDVEQLQKRYTIAEKEVEALHMRIKSMSNTSMRILELRDNPTSRDQAVKASQLAALKEENAALVAQLRGQNVKSVPISTLENAREATKSMERVVAEKEKRMMRLKEIWTSKSNEFREAVYSLLGWKLDFMANGRVRVTHMFGRNGDQSIEFDGERGTMKISGGPESMFAKEIRNQCQFWMPRQNIPCLLASILLEQYEKTTRAQI